MKKVVDTGRCLYIEFIQDERNNQNKRREKMDVETTEYRSLQHNLEWSFAGGYTSIDMFTWMDQAIDTGCMFSMVVGF